MIWSKQIYLSLFVFISPLSCHSLISGSERSIKSAVLVGYSESVLLGGHGWASGSLSDYIPYSTSLTQESVLLHNQKFLNTDIGPSDSSLTRAAVCETEKGMLLMTCILIYTHMVIGYVFLTFESTNNFELDRWWAFLSGYNLYNLFTIKCDKNMKVQYSFWYCMIVCFVDFIGVYQPPVSLEPAIPGFGLMTLTQCKQVCIGGDHTVAMVSRDTCWCGSQADVTGLTQAPSGNSERLSSTPDTFCLGNNIQRCSSKDYVYAYQLGNYFICRQ